MVRPSLLELAAKGDVARLPSPPLEPHLGDNDWLEATQRGDTALHMALKCGQIEFAKVVSQKCPKLLATANDRGDSPLHYVARTGLDDVARHFLKQAHAPEALSVLAPQNRNGDTPLHEAIRGGHAGVVKALLGRVDDEKAGAKCPPENRDDLKCLVDTINESGESPLYLAASNLPVVVDMLLSSGAEVICGPSRQTVLHAAVRKRNEGVLEALLTTFAEYSAQQDGDGNTALHYAASMGSKKMVILLLRSDRSAAHLVDNSGLSPLHVAASMGHIPVVETFLEWCPDCVDITDEKGRSVLHAAVERERSKMVKYMLKARLLEGLINQPDKNGNTPLHLAVTNFSLKMVRILAMDRRVRMDALNGHKLTALDIVIRFDDNSRMLLRRIMSLLRIAGAKRGPMRADIAASQVGGVKKDTIRQYAKHYAQNVALVAILITTITFAAAFTMPGGFKNSGRDEGKATLGWTLGFKAFLISDTLAMCSSATVAFLYVWTVIDDSDYLYHHYTIAEALMWVALLGTVVAFATGVYAVVASECLWLAIVVCIIGCSVPLLVIAGAIAPFCSIFFRSFRRVPVP
ncbi:hypothetical protein Taro_038008 [Colocasia esculenta]|uniref:PGG domain-containing protein n=1 Tax=Colocasia esculenta TaxID=4460 RepID=A0A843WRE3_COLES|nr:hypothetical protein [Colocasia esculenta]